MAEKPNKRKRDESPVWPAIRRAIVSVAAFAALMALLVALGVWAGSLAGF